MATTADASQPQTQWPPNPDARLDGQWVEVRPTQPEDSEDLFAALDAAQVWTHLTVARPSNHTQMQQQVDEARADRFPWTVRLATEYRGLAAGTVVGWSSFMEVSAYDARLEMGATAYDPAVWRTAVNTEAKLLLLAHAFDDLGFSRVQLKTDVRNERSIAGIEGVGASREGVLRQYQRRVDGSLRDTVVFSIVSRDWAFVRERLTARLAMG